MQISPACTRLDGGDPGETAFSDGLAAIESDIADGLVSLEKRVMDVNTHPSQIEVYIRVGCIEQIGWWLPVGQMHRYLVMGRTDLALSNFVGPARSSTMVRSYRRPNEQNTTRCIHPLDERIRNCTRNWVID